jgi:transposase
MPKQYRRYEKDFKLQAAKLVVEHGYTYVQAGLQLGVADWSIRDWVRAFRKSGELPKLDSAVPVADDLKALRAENARLRMENDILKKETAYFAKDIV